MKLKILAVMMGLALSGCTTIDEKYNYEKFANTLPEMIESDEVKDQPFVKLDSAYLGDRLSYNPINGEMLEKPVTFTSHQAVSVQTVLAVIAEQTGLAYRINTAIPASVEEASVVKDWQRNHKIHFEGTLNDFLPYLTSLYNMHFELDENNVLVASVYHRYTIALDYYGENKKFETGMDISGNEATSGSGITGKSETSFESSFWDDVETIVEHYLTSGQYSLIKDSSLIAINARPSEFAEVNKILKKFKEDNQRQFVVTYKIFTLDKSKEQSLGGGINLSHQVPGTTVGITTGMLSSLGSGINFDRQFYGDGKKLNMTGQLEALFKLTGSKLLQSGSFITRNNSPIPLNLTNSKYFVSGRTQTKNDNNTVTDSSVETSQIVTGTSFILTPRVLSDGKIEVLSGFTKKTLNSIDLFESVQLPNVTTTEMFNTSTVTPGSLLMVARYDSAEESERNGYEVLGATHADNSNNNTVVMVVGIDYYRVPLRL
ncbi:type II and III secretion system protein [Vibrio cholerae]|uniref:type II and III secretion system protein n=1 Tax=Vibrio cholerae TaxID=666 RepID=UPI000EE4410F|nr:type II and III secretion system protein [Vibrio cholerae]EKF9125212.1 type II and III secretion system protein [Vibrio cholerae]EKF9143580.1 type II and III secretion system protein [Vibrio cholerae]RJL29124.1 type II and III secretion system protein [Vibrio cholerae]UWY94178.1 type II and III secretion system protein [Vibrio cholerae]UWY97742.1 type II and III secretion system protein [Vibrio cholerae]